MNELHPRVLIQETIDKFGYDPRFLKKNSNKLIVSECAECKIARHVTLNNLNRKCATGLCSSCSRKSAQKNKLKKLVNQIDLSQISIPDFILIQETIDKFGYDPRLLRKNSSRKVIRKCIKCEKIETTERRYCLTGTCRKCRKPDYDSLDDILIQNTIENLGRIQLKTSTYEQIVTVKCSVCGNTRELPMRSARKGNNCHKCAIQLRAESRLNRLNIDNNNILKYAIDFYYSYNPNRLGYNKIIQKDVDALLKTIGANTNKDYSTQNIKYICENFILNQKNESLFVAINYILNHHIALCEDKRGNKCVSDNAWRRSMKKRTSCGIIQKILDKLGFSYHYAKAGQNSHRLWIDSATFFINDKWIFIGGE